MPKYDIDYVQDLGINGAEFYSFFSTSTVMRVWASEKSSYHWRDEKTFPEGLVQFESPCRNRDGTICGAKAKRWTKGHWEDLGDVSKIKKGMPGAEELFELFKDVCKNASLNHVGEYAGKYGQRAECLIEAINPNLTGGLANESLLHIAVRCAKVDIFKKLVKRGANPFAKTRVVGYTPLDFVGKYLDKRAEKGLFPRKDKSPWSFGGYRGAGDELRAFYKALSADNQRRAKEKHSRS